MPFYSCISKAGLLSADQKSRIAIGITDIHCDLTGAPRHFVHVVFENYAPEDGFSGGKLSNVAFIRGAVRGGRSQEIKEAMLSQFTQLWQRECPATDLHEILVSLIETPGTNVMEAGILMPHPKDDAAWLIKHGYAAAMPAVELQQ